MGIKCDYCEETNEYVPIILKPALFFWKDKAIENAQVFRKMDFICLECFAYEVDEIKEI